MAAPAAAAEPVPASALAVTAAAAPRAMAMAKNRGLRYRAGPAAPRAGRPAPAGAGREALLSAIACTRRQQSYRHPYMPRNRAPPPRGIAGVRPRPSLRDRYGAGARGSE